MKINDKPIPLTIKNIEVLISWGFTTTEILIIGACLALTDGCWCSIAATQDIVKILGISERSFYYTIKKLKGLGVEKYNHRYDYSEVIKKINESASSIDKK